jgi:3-dehydroquinate synthase
MQANSSPAAAQIQIDLGERSYPIVIGSGLLGSSLTYQNIPKAATALVVSNTTVAPFMRRNSPRLCANAMTRCCW